MSLNLCPMNLKAAARFVGRHHRHNRPPVGGLFAIGVRGDGSDEPCGVAIVGRPVARNSDDGHTCEVTRLCTTGGRNACSILYGAAARAAKALGYRRIITYTLASEPGTSLRAAGWVRDAEVAADTWNRPNRHRLQTDLFGQDRRPPGPKVRWVRMLAARSGSGVAT